MKLELIDCVSKILDRVKDETGKEVLLFENSTMASMVEAKIGKERDSNHYIAYSSNFTQT